MGVGEPEGGATAQDRGACGAIPDSQAAQQPNSQGKKQPKGLKAQEPRREPGGRRQQGRKPAPALGSAGKLLPRKAARQP